MALIFEVACLSKQILASLSLMPLPLSITCKSDFPASLMISLISVAPASTAFSNSSLTALAGLWITSPAAIWLAILSGSKLMMSPNSDLICECNLTALAHFWWCCCHPVKMRSILYGISKYLRACRLCRDPVYLASLGYGMTIQSVTTKKMSKSNLTRINKLKIR